MVYGKLITPEGNTLEQIKDSMKDISDIREEIFGFREDNKDIGANEVLIIDLNTNEYAAIGRLYMNENYDFVIDLIGVLEKYRGLKYGDFVIRMLVDKAFSCGASKVYAHKAVRNMSGSEDFLKRYNFQSVSKDDVKGVKILNDRDSLSENIEEYMILDRKDYRTCCGHCH